MLPLAGSHLAMATGSKHSLGCWVPQTTLSQCICVFLFLKRKTMDKGEENAASKEKAHILTENGRSGTEECLPELEKKEKGSMSALFVCVRVFPEGFVSILSILETKSVIKNIQWITGNNFTVEKGRQQIEEYISVSDNSIHSGRSCLPRGV